MNRAVTMVSLMGGILAILLSLMYGSVLFTLAAAAFFTFTLLIWKYGYFIIPMFTKATNLIEIRDAYEVPPTRDCIVKKTESGYYVTRFMEIRFYESSIDKNTGDKQLMFEAFERAVSSLKYIVRVTLMVSALDLSKHIDEIKTKRGSVEAKKAKEAKIAQDERMRMDRELAYWNRLLERITQGERPVEILSFASTTAFGLTRDEAHSRASRQSKELRTILSSSLGCDVRDLSDLEMLKCFEWELFFPTTQEEMRDALF